MNLKGEITTDWGDGLYTFRLTVSGAIELEQKCDSPIATIASRLNSGLFKVSDVRETIRLGLIGGGQKPETALRLVRLYVDERPLAESAVIARLVLGGLMFGFSDAPLADPAGKRESSPSGSTPSASTETRPFSGLEDILTP